MLSGLSRTSPSQGATETGAARHLQDTAIDKVQDLGWRIDPHYRVERCLRTDLPADALARLNASQAERLR